MSTAPHDPCQIKTRLDPQTVRQIKVIAAEEGITLTALLAEAIHDLIQARGRAPGEELKRIARKAA